VNTNGLNEIGFFFLTWFVMVSLCVLIVWVIYSTIRDDIERRK